MRLFKNRDEKDLSHIHQNAFREEFAPASYRVWATAPNCRTLVVTYSSRPVGFIIAEKRPYRQIGDFNIAVEPNYQGRGLGRALLRAALRAFVHMGVRRVIADYLLLNTAAHGLYQSHGFRVVRAYNYFMMET